MAEPAATPQAAPAPSKEGVAAHGDRADETQPNVDQETGPLPGPVELLERTADAARRLKEAVALAVVGQDDVVELMLIALAARGHALLVGVPGLAKTLLVASLARALDLSFGRVQFTPDLLPADITGTDVLHEHAGARSLRLR
jgi:MoxR-like ATPase